MGTSSDFGDDNAADEPKVEPMLEGPLILSELRNLTSLLKDAFAGRNEANAAIPRAVQEVEPEAEDGFEPKQVVAAASTEQHRASRREDMYRLLDVEFRYERGLIDRVLQLEIENKELQDRLESMTAGSREANSLLNVEEANHAKSKDEVRQLRDTVAQLTAKSESSTAAALSTRKIFQRQ